MYRCLATAAGSVSRAFHDVSNELQRLADGSRPATHREAGERGLKAFDTSASTLSDGQKDLEKRGACDSSPSSSGSQTELPAAATTSVTAVCEWLSATKLYRWLPLPHPKQQRRAQAQRWLDVVWQPPASESSYHSLTYNTGTSSALLSEMEKVLTNTAAARLGLPARFHWPVHTSLNALEHTTASQQSGVHTGSSKAREALTPHTEFTTKAAVAAPAQAATMLWPTGIRTTTGGIAARPAADSSSSASRAAVLTAALPALPTLVSATQVFASTSSAAPPQTAKTSLVSRRSAVASTAPPRSSDPLPPLSGGGVLFPTALEAYVTLLHTARTQALTRSAGQHNAFSGAEAAARQASKLVLYASDQADPLLVRAAQLIGIPHVRVLQTVAGDRLVQSPTSLNSNNKNDNDEKKEECRHHNYTLDVARVQQRLVEDVAAGLYPVMVVGTFGSGLSGAVDPVVGLGTFCHKLGVWYHLDARHGGPALLAAAAEVKNSAAEVVSAATMVSHRLRAFADEFESAALLADSIIVPAGASALPFSVLPHASPAGAHTASGTLLFVAHVRKVAWSVQALGESRQSTFNQHLTPSCTDSDVLRVSPLSHTCAWLASETAASVSCDAQKVLHRENLPLGNAKYGGLTHTQLSAQRSLARCVAQHQTLAYAVLLAVRSDGRFDASLDAALFGMVHLRWLMAADESTTALGHALAAEINDAASQMMTGLDAVRCDETELHPSEEEVKRAFPPVKVYVGLVQLQRRLWVRLSFGELPWCTEVDEVLSNASGVDSKRIELLPTSKASVTKVLDYILNTLDAAARRVKPDGAV